MQKQLDLSSLERALHSLDAVLVEYKRAPTEFIRDAAIHRFEFTYELSWKMLKRFLEMSAANPTELDEMSFPNLIRTGCEKGLLLTDWSHWAKFRKARSTTSHVYDEDKAIEVFAVIPDFSRKLTSYTIN